MSDRILSQMSYEQLPESLRSKYPIDELWDHATSNIIGNPFRFVRKNNSLFAVIEHNGSVIRVAIVDARCACLLYKIVKDDFSSQDPQVARVLASRSAGRDMISNEEPEFTVTLRRASSNHFRSVGQLTDRVLNSRVFQDDGDGWRVCMELIDTTTAASNVPVKVLCQMVDGE